MTIVEKQSIKSDTAFYKPLNSVPPLKPRHCFLDFQSVYPTIAWQTKAKPKTFDWAGTFLVPKPSKVRADWFLDMASLKAHKNDWLPKVLMDLQSIGELPDNWNGYGAARPNLAALYWAKEIVKGLSRVNLKPTRLVPSAAEGIVICMANANKYADIEASNSNHIVALIKNKVTGERKAWEICLAPDEISRAIDEIQHFLK